MWSRISRVLRRMGHFQSQVLLCAAFFGLVTPYALLLRLFRGRDSRGRGWVLVQDDGVTLAKLRRMF